MDCQLLATTVLVTFFFKTKKYIYILLLRDGLFVLSSLFVYDDILYVRWLTHHHTYRRLWTNVPRFWGTNYTRYSKKSLLSLTIVGHSHDFEGQITLDTQKKSLLSLTIVGHLSRDVCRYIDTKPVTTQSRSTFSHTHRIISSYLRFILVQNLYIERVQ